MASDRGYCAFRVRGQLPLFWPKMPPLQNSAKMVETISPVEGRIALALRGPLDMMEIYGACKMAGGKWMAQQCDLCRAVKRTARERLWDAMADGVFFAWGYLLLLNSNPFSLLSHDVYLPILFFAAIAIILAALSFVVVKVGNDALFRGGRAAVQAYLCAAASCALLGVAAACDLSPIATVLGASALGAGALFSFARLFFCRCADAAPLDVAVEVTMAFAIGIVVFFASIVAFSGPSLLFCHAVMLLFCGLGFLRASADTSGASLALSEVGVDVASPQNVLRLSEVVRPAFFRVGFFLAGLLLAYEFNGTQKTTHFAGVHVDPGQIGGTAFASFEYLLITAFFLVLLVVAYVRSNPIPLAVAVAVLVAASFLSIPTLDRLPFPELAATATVFLFVLWFSLCSVLRTISTVRGRLASYFTAVGFFSSGALAGSVVAFAALAFLSSEPMSLFFAGFQAAVLLAIIISLILFHKDAFALLGGKSPAGALDFSKLEDRCSVLVARYGLTKRESEILALLARGRNVPSVAEELSVSKSTVRSHVLQIYRKAGVSSRQELLDVIYGEGDLF